MFAWVAVMCPQWIGAQTLGGYPQPDRLLWEVDRANWARVNASAAPVSALLDGAGSTPTAVSDRFTCDSTQPLELVGDIGAEARAESDSSLSAGMVTHFGGAYRLDEHAFIYTRMRIVAGPRGKDRLVRGWKGWREDLFGGLDAAGLRADGTWWQVGLVEGALRWGPSPAGGLMLSGDHMPYPHAWLKLHGNIGWFEVAQGWLSREYTTEDVTPVGVSYPHVMRYLAASRLVWTPSDDLAIALEQGALYGGVNRPLELDYLIPLATLYGAQYQRFPQDDNLMMGLAATWRPRRGLTLWTEWLFDDFQIDFSTEPQQIGGLLGARCDLGEGQLTGEVRAVNTTVYGQNVPWNRWLQGDRSLGDPYGPDQARAWLRWDATRGDSSHARAQAFEWGAEFVAAAHGADSAEVAQSVTVPKAIPFPSKPVRYRLELAADALWRPVAWAEGWVRLGLARRDDTVRKSWAPSVQLRVTLSANVRGSR